MFLAEPANPQEMVVIVMVTVNSLPPIDDGGGESANLTRTNGQYPLPDGFDYYKIGVPDSPATEKMVL